MEFEYHENRLPARLLVVSEVARFLGVHSGTVRRWVKAGLLESYSIGLRNNLRFKQEDVLNFLHNYRGEKAYRLLLNDGLDREGRKSTRKRGEQNARGEAQG